MQNLPKVKIIAVYVKKYLCYIHSIFLGIPRYIKSWTLSSLAPLRITDGEERLTFYVFM